MNCMMLGTPARPNMYLADFKKMNKKVLSQFLIRMASDLVLREPSDSQGSKLTLIKVASESLHSNLIGDNRKCYSLRLIIDKRGYKSVCLLRLLIISFVLLFFTSD